MIQIHFAEIIIKSKLFRILIISAFFCFWGSALHAQTNNESTFDGCCKGTNYDGLRFFRASSNTFKAVTFGAKDEFEPGLIKAWMLTTSEANSLSFRSESIWDSNLSSTNLTQMPRPEHIKFNYSGDYNKLSITKDLTVGVDIKANNTVQIQKNGDIELGYRAESKGSLNGVIRYITGVDAGTDALEIYGAGNNYNPQFSRQISLWGEAGIISKGPYGSNWDPYFKGFNVNLVKIKNGIHIKSDTQNQEVSAGCIASRRWTAGLDIVGAGTIAENRKITFWAEAGMAVNGPMAIGIGGVDNIPINIKAEYLTKNNLWVTKGIISEDYGMVNVGSWKDEVLKEGYQLPTLQEMEVYIKQYKHLPGLPSEDEVKANGYSVYEFHLQLLEKVEQLTLYTLQKEHQINELKQFVSDLEVLKEKISEIKNQSTKNPKD